MLISKAIWWTLRPPSCLSSGWGKLVLKLESNMPFCACVCSYVYAYASLNWNAYALVKTRLTAAQPNYGDKLHSSAYPSFLIEGKSLLHTIYSQSPNVPAYPGNIVNVEGDIANIILSEKIILHMLLQTKRAEFRCIPDVRDFVLVAIHTSPSKAPQEIN